MRISPCISVAEEVRRIHPVPMHAIATGRPRKVRPATLGGGCDGLLADTLGTCAPRSFSPVGCRGQSLYATCGSLRPNPNASTSWFVRQIDDAAPLGRRVPRYLEQPPTSDGLGREHPLKIRPGRRSFTGFQQLASYIYLHRQV